MDMRQTLSTLEKNTHKFIQEHNDLSNKAEYLKFKNYVEERNRFRSGSGELSYFPLRIKMIKLFKSKKCKSFLNFFLHEKKILTNLVFFFIFSMSFSQRSAILLEQRWNGIAQYTITTTKSYA